MLRKLSSRQTWRALREIAGKAADVGDVGAAEGVDRLVVIADGEDLAVPGREHPEPSILGVADVLIFVRQHAVEALGPAAPIGEIPLHGLGRP